MEQEIPITKEMLELKLQVMDGDFHYLDLLKGMQVTPAGYDYLRKVIHEFVLDRKVKRVGRGIYKAVGAITPVKWWEADETEYFDLALPRCHDECDDSYFGFADHVKFSPGDLMVIGGVSNAGKSNLALNILGENLEKHECILMGNEFTGLDGRPSPKFKRRMMRMNWVEFMNGNEAKFKLLPVQEDFECYVERDKLNIIDWIYLPKDWFTIGKVLKDIKDAVGKGMGIAVLQKKKGFDLPYGQEMVEHFCDFYISLDPFGDWESRLTVGKVKDTSKYVTDKMWGFKMVDYGANLAQIKPLKKCPVCYGKGWKREGNSSVPCDNCYKKGYIYVEE